MIKTSYSVHKFYEVEGVDDLAQADWQFLRAYKANYTDDVAALTSQLISRVTEVDGVVVSSAVSLDNGVTWVGETTNRSVDGT
jgi:hypothetical protein